MDILAMEIPQALLEVDKKRGRSAASPFIVHHGDRVTEHGFLQSRTGPVIDDKIRKLSDYAIT